MQRVPNFDLVGHEGDMICAVCEEEADYLINMQETETPEKARCPGCFEKDRPEFADAIKDFSELLEAFLEMKNRCMTQEEMHELYGNADE